jgi:hypothetical protein
LLFVVLIASFIFSLSASVVAVGGLALFVPIEETSNSPSTETGSLYKFGISATKGFL